MQLAHHPMPLANHPVANGVLFVFAFSVVLYIISILARVLWLAFRERK